MIAALPREILNALHSLRAVFGGLDNDVQAVFSLHRIFRFQQELCAPQNAGQRVVEVVRHARSQFAQRRHLFNLRKLLANALLLSDIVIQFRDVALGFYRVRCYLFRFSGRSHCLYISQVGAIGQIDNSNDRGSRDEGVKTREVCNLGYYSCRRCSREKCDGRPKIILAPDMPDGLTHI